MKKIGHYKEIANTNEEELINQEIDKSERLRSGILISLLGFEGLVLLVIYMVFNNEYLRLFKTHIAIYAVLIFMAIIMLYELILHYYRVSKNESTLHRSVSSGYLNAFFEVSLLSILLISIILYSDQVIILHSPAALTFFIFIILSTLRLDFKLAVFTGTLAAIEYILISLFFYRYSLQSGTSGLIHTNIQFLGQGLMLIIAGVAAGFVANLIKRKMAASFKTIKEKNEVIDLFGQQISPQIANELLNDRSELIGVRKNVCIMFLDIRNFTPFAESREPEEVVAYLNQLFGFMIEIVQRHHGIINQFLGDGFMATFGAPVTDHDGCLNAVNASQAIIKRLKIEIEKGNIFKTRIGVGLHFGEAVTGNIGSSMRKQYSITGSVVVVASRIENLTKHFKTQMLISEELIVQLPVKTRKTFIPLGQIRIKGSKKMISLYKFEEPGY